MTDVAKSGHDGSIHKDVPSLHGASII